MSLELWATGKLGGEFPALGDGGGIGAVVGEDPFEDVTGLSGLVGDDEESVVVPAAGGADVQAAVAGCGGDDGDADVDCVALVAVGGGGVPEADVGSGVVQRERDRAVPLQVRHGQAVTVEALDCPAVAVADRLAMVGAQRAVVAAGDDDVADARGLTARDAEPDGAEVAEGAAVLLDGAVQGVDVVVGLGDEGDGAAGGGVIDPVAGGPGSELLEERPR